ncbi:hypothetical protein LTR08_005026 [Meristemomyces frigidus]|nr:hypothetical protein LTR08_005026 [Meristemomyces frigidus]
MRTTTTILSATALATLALAAPTPTLNKRATTSDCAQYGSTTASPYIISNDLWGEANGAGSQCYTSSGVSDGSLAWGSTWSWANNANDVKSYANVILDFTATKLSDISSLTTSWDWSYTGDDIVADVSYDLFTNSVASTTSEAYEIMIWLGRLGTAGPIASSYDAAGDPVSIASTTVAGYTFDLYKGSNGIQTATYSFVATQNITSFSGDINDFLTYLVSDQSFDSSQYLVSIGAGTEAFTGSNAVFTTTAFSIAIVDGTVSDTASSSVAASSAAASTVASSVVSTAAAPSTTSSSSSAVSTAAAPSTTSSSSVVAAVSTTAAASHYTAASSSSAAATSVAPVTTAAASSSTLATVASTSVAAAPSSYVAPSGGFTFTGATSAAAASTGFSPYPTGHSGGRPHSPTGSPSGDDCKVQYVYV